MANKTKKTQRPAPARSTRAQIAAREAKLKQERQRKILIGVAVGAVVLLLVVVAVLTANGKAGKSKPIPKAADPAVTCTPDEKSDTTSGHVANPTYTVEPPDGGAHTPSAAPPGIYDVGHTPKDGLLVHSQEHGYIVIWYSPDVDNATLAKIENIFKHHRFDVLLVQRPTLPTATPVVATAWHHRLLCSGADERQLEDFVNEFNNAGPEAVPHSAPPAGRDPKT